MNHLQNFYRSTPTNQFNPRNITRKKPQKKLSHTNRHTRLTQQKKSKETRVKMMHLILGTPSLPKLSGPYDIATKTVHWEPTNDVQRDVDQLVRESHVLDADTTKSDDYFSNGYHEEKLINHMNHGLLVKVWYPIHKKDHPSPDLTTERADYMPQELIPLVQKSAFDIAPSFVSSYLLDFKTNALQIPRNQDIKPIPLCSSNLKYPVLIFSFGLYGVPELYSHICEQLSSEGFIVISPYHTDGSASGVMIPTIKETNKISLHRYNSTTGSSSDQTGNKDSIVSESQTSLSVEASVSTFASSPQDDKSLNTICYEDEKTAHIDNDFHIISFESFKPDNSKADLPNKHPQEHILRKRQITQRIHNVQFLLDKLEQLSNQEPERDDQNTRHTADSFLRGRIDMDRIGMLGHSFGGCTTLGSCLEDKRIKCGVSLDGWFIVYDIDKIKNHGYKDLKVPFMFINAGKWQWEENTEKMKSFLQNLEHSGIQTKKSQENCGLVSPNGYYYTIDDAKHQNFSDIAVLVPKISKWVGLNGGDPIAIMKETCHLLNCFFSFYLKLPNQTKDVPIELVKHQYKAQD